MSYDQAFLRGINDEIIAKLGLRTMVPLTGAPTEPRFRNKNFANTNPGLNHDIPESNHDKDGETGPEQDKNTRTDP